MVRDSVGGFFGLNVSTTLRYGATLEHPDLTGAPPASPATTDRWPRRRPCGENHRVDNIVELGFVTAPSGVLVLGMAGWIDYWPQLGEPLAKRASAAAANGGGHLHDWLCEAVAVPASPNKRLLVHVRTNKSY